MQEAFTFDDLMLVPQHSTIKSRKDPDVSTVIGDLVLQVPIIAAPMNTITEHQMMLAMHRLGATSVLHRYMTVEQQIQEIVKNGKERPYPNFFVAVGATGDYLDRAARLYDTLGIRHFCVDMANGHSDICLKATEALANVGDSRYIIMAGNVCTYEGAYRLMDAGAHIIRVGVGPGSVCKTRIVTGHGVPQLTAIAECVRAKEDHKVATSIVADGGIRNSGDIVKALAMGADAVMVGGLLAGTTETPGDIVHLEVNGSDYKTFAGMASEEGRKFNGWFNETDASFVPEGEATEVPYKGPVEKIINNLVGGLRSGMTYAGANDLYELYENAEWVRVTHNGFVEGTPHGKR